MRIEKYFSIKKRGGATWCPELMIIYDIRSRSTYTGNVKIARKHPFKRKQIVYGDCIKLSRNVISSMNLVLVFVSRTNP